MTADTDPALDEFRDEIALLREHVAELELVADQDASIKAIREMIARDKDAHEVVWEGGGTSMCTCDLGELHHAVKVEL